MRFLSDDIGQVVLQELKNAVEVRLAVAFFSPDEGLLAALARIPKVTFVFSEEFTINNPYKLEKLTNARLLSIPPDHDRGKLHAKVLILKRRNGTYWCVVGSANWTYEGLFCNQEACIALESSD